MRLGSIVMALNRSIGLVAVTLGSVDVREGCARAAELGFDHFDATASDLDVLDADAVAALPLPIGDRISPYEARAGCTSMPLYERRGEDRFDEAVAMFRDQPGARLEPGPRSVADSIEKVEAIIDAVPGLRLTLDTGHVATWGEDPVRLLRHAGHVQLRQAAPGKPQLHPDDPEGVVDFAAVLAELERLDYAGLISIEYFDLPDMRMPLDDPVGHAVALRDHVRPLFR
jgi:sugar phosphate isomerase/epimerase